jgi:phosphoglycerate dehydrogenase-like enzyme
MMQTVLVTDPSLFVRRGTPEEQAIRKAGYDIDWLDELKASEDVLVERVAGKVGYLMGGIETITDRVVQAADSLRAIAFTGHGYTEFIPGWKTATARGIAISANAENAAAVADWSLASELALIRNIPALTTPGGPTFFTARDLSSLTLGIIGFGAIGKAHALRGSALGMTVLATAPTRPSSDDAIAQFVEIPELLSAADIVAVHVSARRGHNVLSAESINAIRSGGIVINAAFEGAVDDEALAARIRAGELRAAVDYPLRVDDAPLGALLASNAQTAFNSAESNDRVAARTTMSLLNLLRTGDDLDLVNPDYRKVSR